SGGSVAYWSGGTQPRTQLTWLDRAGRRIGAIGEPGYLSGFMLSPDGKFAAIERAEAATVDIWLLDVTGGNPSRLTFANYAAGVPIWSHDGRIGYTEWTDRLFVKRVNGNDTEEIPFPGDPNASDYPLSWSPDGQNILFQRNTSQTLFDLWVLPLSGDRKPYPYLNT